MKIILDKVKSHFAENLPFVLYKKPKEDVVIGSFQKNDEDGVIFDVVVFCLFSLDFSVGGGFDGGGDGGLFDDSGLVLVGFGDLTVELDDLLGVDLGGADDAGLADLEVAPGCPDFRNRNGGCA